MKVEITAQEVFVMTRQSIYVCILISSNGGIGIDVIGNSMDGWEGITMNDWPDD